MSDHLQHLRVEYSGDGFTADEAGADPMALFHAWFGEATRSDAVVEPNAMSLATVAPDGTPSNRMVLLKHVDDVRAAFRWYTNLDSRKAREALEGRAAACWWWPGTPGRQVRAVGRVEEVASSESERYFATRPHSAQVGALASRQSRAVDARSTIEHRAEAIEASGELQLPPRWGGLELVADELEFWQGRAGRLHDRITFLRLTHDGSICSVAGAAAAGGADAARAAGSVVTDAYGTEWLRVRLEP